MNTITHEEARLILDAIEANPSGPLYAYIDQQESRETRLREAEEQRDSLRDATGFDTFDQASEFIRDARGTYTAAERACIPPQTEEEKRKEVETQDRLRVAFGNIETEKAHEEILKLRKEIEKLRALNRGIVEHDLAAAKSVASHNFDRWQLTSASLAASLALEKALAVALERVLASAKPHPEDNPTMFATWREARIALQQHADAKGAA